MKPVAHKAAMIVTSAPANKSIGGVGLSWSLTASLVAIVS
jgi:hypothetical protein